ncbi:prepilin-type N-terminal cleavage/methylation domain-containing protein [Desulfobacula sp.]|uniref:prepilin-type N-terminal cleavage/methylation domain-containing protein n=1 Tax=Desulfobacula sp. TaxID=2593537 RepID=UPI002608C11A|nr:prepilin-type N-terminal cleavage/methylation domain-containing protein [Desulfobacula sp.]
MELKINKNNLTLKEHGFTLIEILITMAITGIISTALFVSFQSQQKSYVVQENVAAMQQNLRAGMDMMVREIRMAGYDPYGGSAGAGITIAVVDGNNNSTIEFTIVADDDGDDNNNDGTTDETGELKTIKYEIYDAYGDGRNDLGRQVGSSASTKRAVSENIDALEFFYTLLDGSKTLTPDPALVRSVQITLLARVERGDKDFDSGDRTYARPSEETNWGPYTDNFRRRLLTTTVKCRNMGL